MLKKLTQGGYLLIRIVTGFLGIIFLIYSLFTLWDMYRTELKAFASYDLMKYRPNIEQNKPPYLGDLIAINPDTAAWVTIYGTNIDYPVMKGKDDMEYLNKTATGEYSASGSVYMSFLNSKDFSDPYTLIYGHHMANGSMFGDIDRFKDKDFFYNTNNVRYKEEEGILVMENMVYNLKVIALAETDAYNPLIYIFNKENSQIPELLPYLKENAKYYNEIKDTEKILALSTCDSEKSDGRTVLFCQMTKRTDSLPSRETEPLIPHRDAVGHPMAGAYWAFFNLVIMLLNIYLMFPVHIIKERFSEWRKDRKHVIISLILVFTSILVFILTEDPHKPIQIIDRWTPVMMLILVGSYAYVAIREKKRSEKK